MTTEFTASASPGDVSATWYQRRRVILRPDGNGADAPLASDVRVLTLECDDVRLLALTAEGFSPAAIGRRIGVNERTIRRHLIKLCERLGVTTPVQAVVWAVRHGVI
jgi:DNA-binding CsgD family transcriptional regulator